MSSTVSCLMAAQVKTKKAPTRPRKKPAEPEHVEPWERQNREPASSFGMFEMYRDMGTARSLSRVAQEAKKSLSNVQDLSSPQKWNWTARVAAYDRMLDRVRVQRAVERAERRADEQLDLLEGHQRGLNAAADELLRRLGEDPEGMEKYFKNIGNAALIRLAAVSARAAPRLIEAERLVQGMSTTNVGGHDGGPLQEQARADAAGMDRSAAETYLLGFNDGGVAAGKDEKEDGST